METRTATPQGASAYPPGTTEARYLIAGYSSDLLSYLDSFLPGDSVVIVEDPDVIEARQVPEQIDKLRCVREVIAAGTLHEAEIERLPAQLRRPSGLRAVIPSGEYGVVAAAVLSEAWGFPGAGTRAARIFRDKALLRETAGLAGIPQPEWALVRDAGDVARFRADGPDGGCVLKPTNRAATEGVQILGPDADVAAAWARTVAADVRRTLLKLDHLPESRYLVERRLDGPEVSTELLVENGRIRFFNVTRKYVLPGTHPVEMGHLVPADIQDDVHARLRSGMRTLLETTGFATGVLHGEWIIVDGVPHLIECAGRLPGDHIIDLVELAYDWSLLRNMFTVLEGRSPLRPPERPARSAAIEFLSARPGRVHAVHGVSQARRVAGVRDAEVQVESGDTVEPITSSWQRSGHVLATGTDAPAVRHTLRQAVSMISIETVAEPVTERTGSRSAAS
jgi:biotin carboxylase